MLFVGWFFSINTKISHPLGVVHCLAESIRDVAWVDSAMSIIPYKYAKHYSSTMVSACNLRRVILLRYWG